MKRKVIELIRVSTEGQASNDRAGIASQRAVNHQTAKAYNLDIARTIEITDVSGTAVLKTPEIQELLRLIESSEIHGVVVREFSRLMRPENLGDLVLLQAFAETETLLYLPDGPIDFTSDTGRLIGLVKSWGAGSERVEMLKRAWQAKENNRRKGLFSQSPICLPYGVAFSKEHGWHYTAAAEQVREAFRLFLSGRTGYRDISREVGISATNLRVILQNPIYTGWRVIDKERDRSAKAKRYKSNGRQKDRPKLNRTPENIIRLKVISEPLISETEFQTVQQMMNQKRQRHWRSRSDYSHRFTYHGFLTCKCGQLIYTASQKHDYYVCKDRRLKHLCTTNYMRRDRLDGQLDDLLGQRLTDRQFLQAIFSRLQERTEGNSDAERVKRLNLQLKQGEAKRCRILDMYADGVINRADRDSRLASVETETRRLRAQINHTSILPSMDPVQLAFLFVPFLGYRDLDIERKRKILTALVPEIKVANYLIHGIYVNIGTFSGESNLAGRGALVTPVYLPLELAA